MITYCSYRFTEIEDESALLAFFNKHFQDSIPLIGEDKLTEVFFTVPPSPLVSVKVTRGYEIASQKKSNKRI